MFFMDVKPCYGKLEKVHVDLGNEEASPDLSKTHIYTIRLVSHNLLLHFAQFELKETLLDWLHHILWATVFMMAHNNYLSSKITVANSHSKWWKNVQMNKEVLKWMNFEIHELPM